MKEKERMLIFIPAYRCQAQITRVISQFDAEVQALIDAVIVVDNISPDGTLQAAIDSAGTISGCRFIVWKNDDNYGLGGSHKAAFCYALEEGYEYLIVLHGDDQADIHDLVPFLKKQMHKKVDCLLGARFMKDSRLIGYSKFRTFGNRVYNLLFGLAVKKRVYDLGSGLNLYKLDAFKDFYYKKFPDDLTFNYVMLLASYHREQRVEFFPISWREEDQSSNVRLFRQAFKVLGLLGKRLSKGDSFFGEEMRGRVVSSYSGKIVHDQHVHE